MKKRMFFVSILALSLLLALTACQPESTPLFDASASPDGSSDPSATPPAAASESPSPSPSAVPTVSPTAPGATPTPSPTPEPRFSLKEDAVIHWDGVTRYPGTLTRFGNALNKEEMLGKLLGAAYQTSFGPSVETTLYESGQKSMSLRQYAFSYNDMALMEDRSPLPLDGTSEEAYVDSVRQSLTSLFPAEMLAEGSIQDVSFFNDQPVAVTVRFIRRIDGLTVDDGSEGVQATMVAGGIRELHFQWSDFQGNGSDVFPIELRLAIAYLNDSQPQGAPVRIQEAELAYTNGENTFGVTYVLTWRLTAEDGAVYHVFI